MANRLLTINIRKYLATQPRTKRLNKAVRYIRDRVSHYTKVKPEDVKLSSELNSLIFKRYAKSMERVKLNVNIENDKALVTPFSSTGNKTATQSATAAKPTNSTEKKGNKSATPAKGEKDVKIPTTRDKEKPQKREQQAAAVKKPNADSDTKSKTAATTNAK